jgi:hypothetical protein
VSPTVAQAQILAHSRSRGWPDPAHGKAADECRFHPTRRWRFDYAWSARKVAVEVHGSTWAAGRHTRGKGFAGDREKVNEAQLLGWLVLEVTYDQVRSGQLFDWLDRAMALRRKS